MLLACPACDSRFRVSAAALGEGREVRCSRCANLWHAMPSELFEEGASPATTPRSARTAPFKVEPAMAEPMVAKPEPAAPADVAITPPAAPEPIASEPAADLAELRPRAPRAPRAPVAVVKTLRTNPRPFIAASVALLLCNLLMGVFVMRDTLLRAMPSLQGMYDAFGYEDTRGLKLGDIRLTPSDTAEEKGFDLEGRIYNTTALPKPYPMVVVSLVSASGAVLKAWQFQTDQVMAPGESAVFRNPPDRKLTSMYVDEAEAFRIRLGSARELDLRE